MRATQRRERGRRDRGVALVEFALVAVLLFVLIFGIISFAYMMSFRQAISQGAAEGARAGAVMPAAATDGETRVAARNALNNALADYEVACTATAGETSTLTHDGHPAGTCTVKILDCVGNVTKDCVSVAVDYQYRSNALIPSMPLVSQALPSNLHYTAVAEINS